MYSHTLDANNVCPHKQNVAATKHRYSITTMIPIIAKQAKSMYLNWLSGKVLLIFVSVITKQSK